MDGLTDEPRPGAPRSVSDDQVEQVVVATLERTPREATHWSRASMAAETGLSKSTVGRIWRAFGLKPHLVETFKLSSDPLFIEKVRDVVGLYLNPPERAVVLCVDEKSGIQALNRSSPLLPMMPGIPSAEPSTTPAPGPPICSPRWTWRPGWSSTASSDDTARSSSRSSCPRSINAVPAELDVHLICDNLSTHKTPAIGAWLAAHPRFHLHFTPTSSSWLNQVERWFGLLTDRQIRRGIHDSIAALERDIAVLDRAMERRPQAIHLDQDRR